MVLAAIDIVALISKTVSLKRRGRNYVGLCPFHQEKTGSFNVNPEKQFFHCFGCKKTGNAIDFVMHRDKLDFVGALQLLAKEANIELPRSGASKEQTDTRKTIFEANSAAVRFFELMLQDKRGANARKYIESRKFNKQTLEQFRVGYAPDAWDELLTHPTMKSFDPRLLHQAGLLKQRENSDGFYDTFRDRVMFPIRDETGRTIAFGGRILPGSENPAKYLNSPETPIFSKSRCAFGLDLARPAIVETRTAIICEGYTDVMMCHQYGVRNVVSVLGTALTEQHVQLLRRFCDKIVLLFDADTAGQGATDRSVELFLTQPIEIMVASLPEGQDPDEVLIAHGPDAFKRMIGNGIGAIEFMFRRMKKSFQQAPNDLTGQQKAIEAFLGRLSEAKKAGPVDDLRWGQVLVRVEKMTGVPASTLQQRFGLKKAVRRVVGQKKREWTPGFKKKSHTIESPAVRRSDLPGMPGVSSREVAERWVIGCVLHDCALWDRAQQVISPDDFQTTFARAVIGPIWEHLRGEGEIVLRDCLEWFDDIGRSFLIEVEREVAESKQAQKLIEAALQWFEEEHNRQSERQSIEASRDAQSDDDEVEALKKLSQQMKRPDISRSAG